MIDCIVIGAGPGGIVCTKELLENGVDDVLCLEQGDRLGGVFSRGYDGLRLTSSATFSMFSDYGVKAGDEHTFWTKDEVVAYWSGYARHYKVTDKIRFNTRVSSVVRRADGGWCVHLTTGEALNCARLVLAAGNNSVPRYPGWKHALTEIDTLHAAQYRNASAFAGKRVLVVGGGESGSDIALEIAKVAEQTWVSLRSSTGWVVPRKRDGRAADVSTHRGLWGLPRDQGEALSRRLIQLERERGKRDPVFDAVADLNSRVKSRRGVWGTYGTKTLALPEAMAHYGCKVVGDIVEVAKGGRHLTSADGYVLDQVDAVVFCTGYTNRVAFMPEGLREGDPRSLYKHMFHPDIGDRLAWIGWARPGFGSQFPIMEMQARYFGLICSGAMSLPPADRMEHIASLDRAAYLEQFEDNAYRIRSLVDYHRYMDDLADTLGCSPPLWRYFLTRPALWLHLVYGPTQATQFRLRGPGAKVAVAHGILRRLPVSTFNHVVKAGLRGRLVQAWKALSPFKPKTTQPRSRAARLSGLRPGGASR